MDDIGEERADTLPGHLIFVINEMPHPFFKRNRNDLHIEFEITLKDALLGTK